MRIGGLRVAKIAAITTTTVTKTVSTVIKTITTTVITEDKKHTDGFLLRPFM